NPRVTTQKYVPLIGEVMASRWGFEALAVNQFQNNRYEKNRFEIDKAMSNATFKKDFWITKMNDKLDSVFQHHDGKAVADQVQLLKNELRKEAGSGDTYLTGLVSASMDETSYQKVKQRLDEWKHRYIQQYKSASEKKDSVIHAMSGG